MKRLRLWCYGLLAVLIMLCVVVMPAGSHSYSQANLTTSQSLFESGQYSEAVQALQKEIQKAEALGDTAQQAVALGNLSLVLQSMGQWSEAEDAIAQSLTLLTPQVDGNASAPAQVLAQVMNIQGRLQFSQGQSQAALNTWEQASELYADIDDQIALVRVGINRAEALQSLGLYRQAIALLTDLTSTVSEESGVNDAVTQATALRRLGEALRVSGDLDQSAQVLSRSWAIAQQSNNRSQMVRSQLSLGNTAYSTGDLDAAWAYYDQVINQPINQPTNQTAQDGGAALLSIQAQLNQLRILVDRAENTSGASSQSPALILATTDMLVPAIDQLPLNSDAIATRINLAKTLLRLTISHSSQSPVPRTRPAYERGESFKPLPASFRLDLTDLATRELVTAYQQSQTLGHQRLEAIALTTLGNVYETSRQFEDAQQLTEKALSMLPSQSDDVAYQLHWQLGRIYAAKGERQDAIAAYDRAVKTLKGLRNDLVAVSANAQFSFRSGVEPVYRELASLLLAPDRTPTAADLEQARYTIEQLQLAELDNFFREACLDTTEVAVDEVDAKAAVLYPIILDDRLELIISLPQQTSRDRILKRYTTSVPAETVDRTVTSLIQFLRQPSANWRSPALSQQVYDWLIRPAEPALEESGIDTLVFVLDGTLRNLPMAVLQDGETFLIEKYAVALTPGLQLFDSQALPADGLNALVGGLSESRQDFPALPGVQTELTDIQSQLSESEVLLNETFTSDAIQDAINQVPFPVVHLATHGEFSSNLEDTYILTWSDRLSIDQLNSTLKAGELRRDRPIELLVLSACQTAEGDDLAALGLAGMAVRAGARSTVATLWQLSDAASPILMERFYRELRSGKVTKAQALRQAQLTLLNDPTYSLPYFWSPIVLVGNWI
ncbi:MAG: CHAT domain-containing protein [Cyanobacteria bacterium P01_F01_bin.150]